MNRPTCQKRCYVENMQPGVAVDDPFLLAERQLGRKRDGNRFLNLVLSDRSGSIKAVAWDVTDDMLEAARSGEVVRVRGNVSEYRGAPQLVVAGLAPVAAAEVDPDAFLPAPPKPMDCDALFERLRRLTGELEDPDLRRLLAAFWKDEALVVRFKLAPAAKKMHHAYRGGLLEHTLSMAVLAVSVARHYRGVDRDMLIAGAVLHDIGKIDELDYRLGIDYSDEGRLLSHIVIGCRMIDRKVDGLADFPPRKALLLKHMVVSHHGLREFGSPEPPKTIEAVLLNHIDEIDAKVNGIRQFMAAQPPGDPWTPFHRMLGRQFYRGDAPQGE